MLLDKYLSFETKIFIAIISGAIWIYFRDLGCYRLLPRKSFISILFVSIWIYINYYEPLAIPIGLITMYIYSKISNKKIRL